MYRDEINLLEVELLGREHRWGQDGWRQQCEAGRKGGLACTTMLPACGRDAALGASAPL